MQKRIRDVKSKVEIGSSYPYHMKKRPAKKGEKKQNLEDSSVADEVPKEKRVNLPKKSRSLDLKTQIKQWRN